MCLGRLQNHFGYNKEAPGGLKSTRPAYMSNLPLKIWGRWARRSRVIPSTLCSTRRLHTTSVSSSTIDVFLSAEVRLLIKYCPPQQIIFSSFIAEIGFSRQNNTSNFRVVMKKAFFRMNSSKRSSFRLRIWRPRCEVNHLHQREAPHRRISAEAALMSVINFHKLDFKCPIKERLT